MAVINEEFYSPKDIISSCKLREITFRNCLIEGKIKAGIILPNNTFLEQREVRNMGGIACVPLKGDNVIKGKGYVEILDDDIGILVENGVTRIRYVFHNKTNSICVFDSPKLVKFDNIAVPHSEKEKFRKENNRFTITSDISFKQTKKLIPKPYFTHDASFKEITLHGTEIEFTPAQAKILKIFYDALASGHPWVEWKDISTSRPYDVFRSRKDVWRCLLEYDGEGKYRLNPSLFIEN